MLKKLCFWSKWIILANVLTFLFAGYGFAQCDRVPLQEALDAMASDAEVAVSTITMGS